MRALLASLILAGACCNVATARESALLRTQTSRSDCQVTLLSIDEATRAVTVQQENGALRRLAFAQVAYVKTATCTWTFTAWAVTKVETPTTVTYAPVTPEAPPGAWTSYAARQREGEKRFREYEAQATVASWTAATAGSGSAGCVQGSAGCGTVHVRGYYRANGKYVQPYTRSAPRR